MKTKGLFSDFAFKEIPEFVLEALKPIGGILDVSKEFALVYEEKDDKVSFLKRTLYKKLVFRRSFLYYQTKSKRLYCLFKGGTFFSALKTRLGFF